MNEFKTNEEEIDNTQNNLSNLKSFNNQEEKKSDEFEEEFFKTESTEDMNESCQSAKINDNSDFYLIDHDKEMYRSIDELKLKTSMIISQKNNHKNNFATAPVVTGQEITVVNSVNEMANILVRSVLNQAMSDYNESVKSDKTLPNIEKKYRYRFSAKAERDLIDISDFSKNKTSSRLTYYKDFNFVDANEFDEENNEEKITLEFEDEPYE